MSQALRSSVIRWASRAFAAALIGLSTASTLLASEAPKATEQDYVKSYGLTILACIAGLTVVGRSSRRTTEIKFRDDG